MGTFYYYNLVFILQLHACPSRSPYCLFQLSIKTIQISVHYVISFYSTGPEGNFRIESYIVLLYWEVKHMNPRMSPPLPNHSRSYLMIRYHKKMKKTEYEWELCIIIMISSFIGMTYPSRSHLPIRDKMAKVVFALHCFRNQKECHVRTEQQILFNLVIIERKSYINGK